MVRSWRGKFLCFSYFYTTLFKFNITNRGSGYENNVENELTPRKVESLADEVIVQVACGRYHTCAVTSTGSIYTWGSLATGHGERVTIPMMLQGLSSKQVVCISAYYHTACITRAGEVFTWGSGACGRLGHGDEKLQSAPKRVEALVGVKAKQVACGFDHTALCTEDGQMYTFGNGRNGQLGLVDTEHKASPALVQALEGKHIVQVKCGCYHTMALTSSGYVFTWGQDNTNNRLWQINSQFMWFSIPCLVEGLRDHNVVQISTYRDHCAVLVDPKKPSPIRQAQQASFNNQQHSDVVIMVENEPLYANVDLLSQKCEYFAAMFRSNMRESIEMVVKVSDCSKAAFLRVLEYLYLDDCSVSIDNVVELWQLADMYQLEGLKLYCLGALERGLCEENVPHILEAVEDLRCPCDGLKRMCHDYLKRKNKDGRL
jgi:hypothetical protein